MKYKDIKVFKGIVLVILGFLWFLIVAMVMGEAFASSENDVLYYFSFLIRGLGVFGTYYSIKKGLTLVSSEYE